MPKRIEKVNSLLEHEINQILLHDFNFSPDVLITLMRVDATANLIEAKVYMSIFPETQAEKIIKNLNSQVRDVQQKINKKLNMRPIPKIIFVKDSAASRAGRVEELLSRIKNS
jgi:ribosome-binding factor A